jgi:hypothetical protein
MFHDAVHGTRWSSGKKKLGWEKHNKGQNKKMYGRTMALRCFFMSRFFPDLADYEHRNKGLHL